MPHNIDLITTVAASLGLAQIGEFSFILAALGVSLGLMPVHGQSLIAAASGQVVLVGYGRVGRRIAQALAEHRTPYVVAEQTASARMTRKKPACSRTSA